MADTTYRLALYEDRWEARSGPLVLSAGGGTRALYIVDGALQVRSRAGGALLGGNSAWLGRGEAELGGGSLPSTVLRWELGSDGRTSASWSARGLATRLVLEAPLELADPGGYLLRCDRVDFPPGGEALLHRHQGGGIRCLLFGSIRIETQGAVHRYQPLEAWFERGPDPVYAAADAERPSAFARVMILPRRLLGGKSSIEYLRPEDAARPKSQRYQIFLDEPIDL
jgi:hypothetical protein